LISFEAKINLFAASSPHFLETRSDIFDDILFENSGNICDQII